MLIRKELGSRVYDGEVTSRQFGEMRAYIEDMFPEYPKARAWLSGYELVVITLPTPIFVEHMQWVSDRYLEGLDLSFAKMDAFCARQVSSLNQVWIIHNKE